MKLTDSDKIVHSKGGTLAAVYALCVSLVLFLLGAHPLTIGVAAACTAVAFAIEGMQWVENRTSEVKRDVSGWDAFATAYPGLVLAAVVELAIRKSPQVKAWLGALQTLLA